MRLLSNYLGLALMMMSCNNIDLENYCVGHDADDVVVLLEGRSGDFYMKKKVVEGIDGNTFDQICSQLDHFSRTWQNGRGSDYSISFYFKTSENITLIEMYRVSSPEPGCIFWIGLNNYTNDRLAALLIDIIDVEDVRTSDEYIIDSW